MQHSDHSKRWTDKGFLSENQETLKGIFVLRRTITDLDLKGLTIGLEGTPQFLAESDFQDVSLERVDLSYARLSCPFSRARIKATRFDRAVLDTCRFKQASFEDCTFLSTHLDSPTLDDAVFSDCNFSDAKIIGRGNMEYGGRRTCFERCRFTNTKLKNLQLRAWLFRNCEFNETIFEKCLIVGLKVEGQRPLPASFINCHV